MARSSNATRVVTSEVAVVDPFASVPAPAADIVSEVVASSPVAVGSRRSRKFDASSVMSVVDLPVQRGRSRGYNALLDGFRPVFTVGAALEAGVPRHHLDWLLKGGRIALV